MTKSKLSIRAQFNALKEKIGLLVLAVLIRLKEIGDKKIIILSKKGKPIKKKK